MSDEPATGEESQSAQPPGAPRGVRASQLLKIKKIWLIPLLLGAIFVALMSVIYIGSVVNPTGHLHNLPVVVVNEDTGASAQGKHVDIGAGIVSTLRHTPAVAGHLDVRVATLAQARASMNRADAYATLVIPATLSRSVLLDAGAPGQGSSTPARATVTLLENERLGSLGVSLASAVLTPAVEEISKHVGAQLKAEVPHSSSENPVVAAQLADPIALSTETFRPLPDHTALGLSDFYIALLSLMAGFIGGTLINSSIDGALGYATTEVGPRWAQRRPVAINRLQTLIIKWVTALIAAPVLTGILMLIAVLGLGMNAPDWLLLWGVLALASLMVATGTLALFAAFGSIGQLLALLLIVYLSLASSGGTVPIQALPGVFRVVAHVEPLRQVLLGTRAILYFNARGDAGLSHSLLVITAELLFWALVGIGFVRWYDYKGLDRISPDLIAFIERSVAQREAELEASATDKA